MSRRHLLWAAAAVLAVAAGAWFANAIEWVDDDVTRPSRGEAARDDFYAARQLVRKLGGQADAARLLDAPPPPGDVLVLTSARWHLYAGGDEALRRWVEAGGRLVVLLRPWTEATAMPAWVPIAIAKAPSKPGPGASGTPAGAGSAAGAASVASAASAAAAVSASDASASDATNDTDPPPVLPKVLARLLPGGPCEVYSEPEGVVAAFGQPRGFRVCGFVLRRLQGTGTPAWLLADAAGSVALRVALGRGSVTIDAIGDSFANEAVLRHDGALVLAAALQLRAGDRVWFVDEASRQRFLAALWAGGWPALVLAALALALALWRAGVRFGPTLRETGVARRSTAEQVRRTAAFIAGDRGSALPRAAVRALDEEALRTVPGYAALAGTGERAAAIARAAGITGHDATALADAMTATPTTAGRGRAAGAIAALEHARRALRARRRPSLSPSLATATSDESP